MSYYAIHRKKPDDEICHFKYIDKYMKNGKWQYVYDTTENRIGKGLGSAKTAYDKAKAGSRVRTSSKNQNTYTNSAVKVKKRPTSDEMYIDNYLNGYKKSKFKPTAPAVKNEVYENAGGKAKRLYESSLASEKRSKRNLEKLEAKNAELYKKEGSYNERVKTKGGTSSDGARHEKVAQKNVERISDQNMKTADAVRQKRANLKTNSQAREHFENEYKNSPLYAAEQRKKKRRS